MRIMYVASNPEGADPLLIDREISDMRDQLDHATGLDPIDFRPYPNLPVTDLAAKLREFRPDVLHVAAHGSENAVALAHPTKGHVLLDAQKLAALISGLPAKPRLIVLNACSSTGMAADLVSLGAASFVIGTGAPITNHGAQAMAAVLYRLLAEGASIADAFTVAKVNLDLIDGGEVEAILHPAGSIEAARSVQLVDPLRIVACLPAIEEWLDAGLVEPGEAFRPEFPKVRFGVAGAPAAARQTVFFTDDETVTKPDAGSLEEARSWIIESQPWNGEIWMPDEFNYYGDMSWFAAITTTDRRVVSVASSTSEALRRYYLNELWRGPLPDPIIRVLKECLECLERNGGSRRGRRTAARAEET